MRKSLLLILAGSALALAACGETSSKPADSSATPSATSSLSSNETTSSEPSALTDASSSDSEPAASSESSSAAASSTSAPSSNQDPAESWTLTVDRSLLTSTQQSQYLSNFTFNATRSDGQTISFFGDGIQQGNGEWDGTIQMKKADSYIYSKAALASCHVTMGIKIRGYGGNDFSGTPTFYSGESENPTTVKTSTFSEKDGVRVFEFDMEGYFKLANLSNNAMYVTSINFVSI